MEENVAVITLTIDYNLNGVAIDRLIDMAMSGITNAVGMGILTGDSEAEVESWVLTGRKE